MEKLTKAEMLYRLHKQIESLRCHILFGGDSDELQGQGYLDMDGICPLAMQYYLFAINALEQASLQFNIASLHEKEVEAKKNKECYVDNS